MNMQYVTSQQQYPVYMELYYVLCIGTDLLYRQS